MEPGSSQVDNPPERSAHRLANILGTFIALLTLAIPIFAIAHFSSSSAEVWEPPAYPLQRSAE